MIAALDLSVAVTSSVSLILPLWVGVGVQMGV